MKNLANWEGLVSEQFIRCWTGGTDAVLFFSERGARAALRCTFGETAETMWWRIHAWPILADLCYVALANLVYGMQHG